MSVLHGKAADHNFGVALDAALRSIDVAVDVDLPDTSCMGDSAKECLPGMYGWGMDAEYLWDPAASENDVTIQAQIGGAGTTVDVTPGGGAASATNPKYSGTGHVKSYRISVPHDGVITSRCSYQGDGALSRVVA